MPMIIEDKKILQEIRQSKNLTLSSIKNYECAMRQYTTYNQMSMTELLKEAEKEEEGGVRWKHRQIRRRLIGFRAYLLQNKNLHGKDTNNLPILRNRVTSPAKCQHTQQAQHSNKVRGFTNQGHNPKSSQQYRLPDESHHTIHE